MRVGIRLMVVIGILTGVMLATSVFTISFYFSSYRARVEKDALLHASNIAHQIVTNLGMYRESLELFLVTSQLGDKLDGALDREELSLLLEKSFKDYFEVSRGYDLYLGLCVTDAQGRVLGGTNHGEQDNLADEPWWRDAILNGVGYSDITYQPEFETYSITIAVVIRGSDGDPVGVLRATLPPTSLVSNSGILSRSASAVIVELTNEEGRLVYATRLFRYFEDLSEMPYFIDHGESPSATVMEVNGVKDYIVAYPLADLGAPVAEGWCLFLRQPYKDVFGTAIYLRNRLLVVAVIVVILATSTASLLSKGIATRIEKLSVAVADLGRGDLQRRANIKGKDEIAQLGQVFDQMAMNLERNTEELKEEIDERERVEASLAIQAERLRRSNEELEHFAYVASHDLQEPLRIIVSYLQLIERRYLDKLDDDGKRFIKSTITGAERMRSLIRGLLQYSRVSTKGLPFEEVDMESVLDETLENLGQALKESGAVIERTPLPHVRGDRTQLVQLVQNLISNALKFTENGTTPHVSIAVTKHSNEWEFTIKDNGIGIEEQYTTRIFALFQRLHTRDQYEGTGIGLTVCKRIVERHFGRIWLKSEAGQGTTFHFTIPVKEARHA